MCSYILEEGFDLRLFMTQTEVNQNKGSAFVAFNCSMLWNHFEKTEKPIGYNESQHV